MNNNRRRNFRSRPQKNNFRRRGGSLNSNGPNNLSNDIKRYEPRMALDGGNDGLDLIKKVIYKSKKILKLKGILALEIGNGQVKKVSKILFDNKFRIKHVINDYKNNVRCVISHYN